MTAFEDDPLLQAVTDATDRLLTTIRSLDDGAVHEPSLLPGWSRGHVLTHIARNADGIGNVLRTAITGEVTPMYVSKEARDADIQAGAGRSAADLEADVESSAERLLALFAEVPADQLDLRVPDGRGRQVRVRNTTGMRLSEVDYHHVDLATAYTFEEVPDLVLHHGLTATELRFNHRDDVPAFSATGRLASGETVSLKVGDDGPEVEGPAGELLAWLTGRSDGKVLTVVRGGSLPALPAWG